MKKFRRVGLLFVVLALLLCLPALGAEETDAEEYLGPLVRNTTEEFPVYASLFSGSPPTWSDTGAFRDGVYEGYYAQLDGVTRLFYDELKTLLADPAAAYTDANMSVMDVSDTLSLPCYLIELSYPEEIAFPTATASSQTTARSKLASIIYKYVITAYDALSRDHPEMPWLSCCYGYALYCPMQYTTSGSQYTYSINTSKPFELYLANPSPTVLSGCADGSYQAGVDAAVAALNDDGGLYDLDAPDKSDYDKVKGIHDYLCRTVSYAYDNDTATGFDQCAYSALVSPYQTVCAGYASSAKVLCDRYGVPCAEITGLGGERHAWNYVRMDGGGWYAMDCTWDDTGGWSYGDGEPVYDFFLKGNADPVPCGWATAGSVPFPESHIATSTWSDYTAMPYPTLEERDYAVYYLAQPPAAVTAGYGAGYADVTVTGAVVQRSESDETPVSGKWFLGDWTDKQNLFSSLDAPESYPGQLQTTVYFSQNPDFDPTHIYNDPYDYPVTAAVSLTATQAPLTIRSATVSSGAVTAVTFHGLREGEQLTLNTDYTASAVSSGSGYDVTVTLLDTDRAKNYTLESNVFNTASGSTGAAPTDAMISHSSLSLAAGESQRLSITYFPADAVSPSVTWSSSSALVATVDQTGLVTAVAAGSCTVSAKMSGLGTFTIPVTVTAAPVPTGLALNKTAVYLTLGGGETEQLTATILPAGTTGVVKWSSDNPNVVSVSDGGLVAPEDTGWAMITASLYASSSSTTVIAQTQCMVSVFSDAVPATAVTLDRHYAALKRGGTLTLGYTLAPDDTTDKSLAWTSSDPSVATVTSAGVVTAVGKGSAVITLSTGTPGVLDVCDVEVIVPVTSVSLDQNQLSLIEEDTFLLSASVLPEDTSYPTARWASDNTAVATVDETGLVTAVGPGSATITATAGTAATGTQSDSCAVTVAAQDFTIALEDVSFGVSVYGYDPPQAQALVIRSLGNRPAAIASVALDSADFTLDGGGDTVPVGGTLESYTVRPAAGLDAGSYSAVVTVTYDNDATATAQLSFTVIRADADYGDALVVTNGGSPSSDFVYGDVIQVTFLPQSASSDTAVLLSVQPAQNEAALYLGDTLLAGPVTADSQGKYVLTCDTADRLVPLGDQTLAFRYGGSVNFNSGGADLPVTLSPKPLSQSMAALNLPAEGYAYDGAEKTPSLTVTHRSATLTPDADYTVSFAQNVNAGTAEVTVTGQDWYTGQIALTFSIAPQTGRALSLTAPAVLCADTGGQSFALAPAVSALALESDVPVYQNLRVTQGGACLAEYGVDEAGRVTFALADGLDGADTVVLALEVTGLANYDQVAVTLTVPIEPYREVEVDLSGLDLADRPYNGQSLTWSGQAAGAWSGGEYAGDFAYTWHTAAGEALADAPVDAGTYLLRAAAADLGFRGQGDRRVTISPATVTVTPGSYQVSKSYDGTADPGAPTGELEVAGILPADSGVFVTADVGGYESPDVGGQSQLTAALTLQGDSRGNYVLAADHLAVPCAITPKSASVTALAQQLVYGEAVIQDADRAEAAGLLEGHRLESLTLAGETLLVPGGALTPADARIVDGQGRDVTGNYALRYTAGVLTVTPKALTVTARDAQLYRGRPLTDPDFTVDGLVAGDSFAAPQVTLASTGETGTRTILLSGGTLTNAGSYTVTYLPGTLTILEPSLALAGDAVWDGETTTLALEAVPEDLLTGQETLALAARYEDGAMVQVIRGAVTETGAVFPADLTAQGGWKVFFLDAALAPLCPPLTLT